LTHRDTYALEPNVGFQGTAEVDRKTALAGMRVARCDGVTNERCYRALIRRRHLLTVTPLHAFLLAPR